MNEDKKQLSGELLIELEKEQVELARKQLFFSKLTCILSAIICMLMIVVAFFAIRYIPDIANSMHNLESLNHLSEVEFDELAEAINKLNALIKTLPFV